MANEDGPDGVDEVSKKKRTSEASGVDSYDGGTDDSNGTGDKSDVKQNDETPNPDDQ